jgi:hypothetical protein
MNAAQNTWISPRAVLFAEHFDLSYPGPEPGELEFLLRRRRSTCAGPSIAPFRASDLRA